MVAVVSRRAALLVADALLCVLWVWENAVGRAAAPVVVCASVCSVDRQQGACR